MTVTNRIPVLAVQFEVERVLKMVQILMDHWITDDGDVTEIAKQVEIVTKDIISVLTHCFRLYYILRL